MQRFRATCVVVTLTTLTAFGSARLQGQEKGELPSIKLPSATVQVRTAAPILHWTFEGTNPSNGEGKLKVKAKTRGSVKSLKSDLTQPTYLLYGKQNRAGRFDGGWIVVPDTDKQFDFENGDEITIETYVQAHSAPAGKHIYLIGKGRTNNKGFARENQNYAFRLTSMGGSSAAISFLFRSEASAGQAPAFHRWTSKQVVTLDGRWCHIAVTYRFGDPKSIRGYINGQPTEGSWDKSGPTTRAPVVDDDELWIGSSLGGHAGVTFRGWLDDLAIHRRILSPSEMANRYRALPRPEYDWKVAKRDMAPGKVRVEIFEKVPADIWSRTPLKPHRTYEQSALAANRVAEKYDQRGVRAERSNPFRLRLSMLRTVEAGPHRLLLRAKNATRLFIDGRKVAELGFMKRNASGHEPVPDLLAANPNEHAAPAGHQETKQTIELEGGVHLFRLETIVGGKGLRAELGELLAAIAPDDEPFRLLTPDGETAVGFNEDEWSLYTARHHEHLQALDQQHRRRASSEEIEYWRSRHDAARDYVAGLPALETPTVARKLPRNNRIDDFINVKLAARKQTPAKLTDDYAFLRRVTLDLVGRNPTASERSRYFGDAVAVRRQNAIDRLLQSPEWADNWMGYWQDVLAENPGILKPKLNNTGPFRWWIHESLTDNKPLDRFVTELVAMQGSAYGGGPGGFAMATQNDVPMAAKAHVLSQAFLGLNMKCARCHDAPFRPFTQKQLFSVASMLQKSSIVLPKTSSAPVGDERESVITVSLKPGSKIAAAWPFAQFGDAKSFEQFLRSPNDSRERLALLLTNPANQRFAEVMANRLWARYLGWGIVDPVDDWFETEPSHPKLLAHLGRELTRSGYDMKELTRQILNSHAYQRVATHEGSQEQSAEQRTFASPRRRRLTAEQVVDSLIAASGKSLSHEMLTLDPEGRRTESTFLNLGVPRRGWELTSLSNERDRPALALPTAQTITDVLIAFGWRDARPNPITNREESPTILQPLTIANGVLGNRAARLSDDSQFTELALAAPTPDQFVEEVFLALLGRAPTTDEREPLAELLRDGFESRRTGKAKQIPLRLRNAVSWSNHLHADATRIKNELERKVNEGDPPTLRLTASWRDRAEDVVWAVANSPEFVFVP